MSPLAPSRPASTGGHRAAWTAREGIELQQIRHCPAVSLLMTARPAPTMTVTDQTRLADLLDQATRRLQRLTDVDAGPPITTLRRLVDYVPTESTGHAVALSVAGDVARSFRLGL